jgi:hypothetical protein
LNSLPFTPFNVLVPIFGAIAFATLTGIVIAIAIKAARKLVGGNIEIKITQKAPIQKRKYKGKPNASDLK